MTQTPLRTRLHAYLTNPVTWQIPALGVLTGCTGTVLAALVGVPVRQFVCPCSSDDP